MSDYKWLSEIRERLVSVTRGKWELSSSGYSVRGPGGHKICEANIVPARCGEMVDTLKFLAHSKEDVERLLALSDVVQEVLDDPDMTMPLARMKLCKAMEDRDL